MILVDTSIVIELFRAKGASILDVVATGDAAICGVTRAEVLHGARDANHREKLIAALDLFPIVVIGDALWDQVGDNLAALRAGGVTVPLADAIIATVALVNQCDLWTRDQHFLHIQRVMPALTLFEAAI